MRFGSIPVSANRSSLAPSDSHNEAGSTLLSSAYLSGRGMLHRFLRFKTRNDSVADDLLQDLWFRVIRISGSERVRDPTAFLRTIASNLATDWLRRRSMIAGIEAPLEGAEDIACGSPTAFDCVASREAIDFLVKVIDELPPRRRQAFLLHRFELLTMAQAANRMGTSPETVERQVAQALSYCHARLMEFGWQS